MATKLPSGKYRTQVFVGYVDGKRKYKSFIASTAKKANLAALQWQAEHPVADAEVKTLETAAEAYIRLKKAVLSPSTIRAYCSIEKTLKSRFSALCKKKLDMITSEDLQIMINEMVGEGLSAKTCRNWYGFLSAIWKANRLTIPDVTLPTRTKKPLNIPDEKTLHLIYEKSRGTRLEIPIYLASIGPMRRGEIVAATIDDLEGNVLHVHRAAVKDEEGNQVIKEYPKTYESTRDIPLPDDLVKKIRERGCICEMTLGQLSDSFDRFLKKNGIEHFRFHDLRHAFVSICHAAGVPDAYIQQRGGWATNYTMNNVYRHTLTDIQKKENDKINRIFDGLI